VDRDPIVLAIAGDHNQDALDVPAPIQADWTATAVNDGHVTLVVVDGDGTTSTRLVDLTPRYGGQVDQVGTRRQTTAQDNVRQLNDELRHTVATVAGRSLLAGLQSVGRLPGRGVIDAISSGLDVNDPLDLRKVGWDTPPGKIVDFLRRTGNLPHLAGRTVVIVLVEPAGDQPRLDQPSLEQLQALWQAIITASGAHVSFVPADPAPAVATVAAPVVPVPAPAVWDGNRCTLATTVFHFGAAQFVNRSAAAASLRDCAQHVAGRRYRVTVIGHTSQEAGTSVADGLTLSTQRAWAVQALMTRDLGIPAADFTQVKGVGATQTLCAPLAAACNRAVVVTFTPTT
jgi:hypothetical protein